MRGEVLLRVSVVLLKGGGIKRRQPVENFGRQESVNARYMLNWSWPSCCIVLYVLCLKLGLARP